jgi:hypothetical protein
MKCITNFTDAASTIARTKLLPKRMAIAAKTEANARKAIMPNVLIAKNAKTANVLIAAKTAFVPQEKIAARKPDQIL